LRVLRVDSESIRRTPGSNKFDEACGSAQARRSVRKFHAAEVSKNPRCGFVRSRRFLNFIATVINAETLQKT
jgi:hypothetical protein